eukprot:GHVT01033587.1.p2 GENE.GHVT01033587.1~~GHVT01033587.1.p2  ORF type:complete len:104 (+),score=12.19 GHVT01033587.1:172-483(+)
MQIYKVAMNVKSRASTFGETSATARLSRVPSGRWAVRPIRAVWRRKQRTSTSKWKLHTPRQIYNPWQVEIRRAETAPATKELHGQSSIQAASLANSTTFNSKP